MGIASIHSKKRMADIRDTDDTIDTEFSKRLLSIRSRNALADFLEDYSDFLPDGLQRFRNAPDEACRKIMIQVVRVYRHTNAGQPVLEPNEATILAAPPMITAPRILALMEKKTTGRQMTWGQAFKRLVSEGVITRLMKMQDRMYRLTIEFEETVGTMVDTDWMPGERWNIPGDGDGRGGNGRNKK